MKYLLDTDVVTILYDDSRKEPHKAFHRKISLLNDEDWLQTSVLVMYELEYSFCNAPEDKKEPIRHTINSVLNDFDSILSLELEAAPIFGKLKALLKQSKNLDRKAMRRHNVDLMLASTAIQTDSILIGMDLST